MLNDISVNGTAFEYKIVNFKFILNFILFFFFNNSQKIWLNFRFEFGGTYQ